MDPNNLEVNERTHKELLCKNKSLSEQLQQCMQDKEFVWNLWKELQVTNPNTANIINTVIEREQEKSDIKAAKVLTVLQEKDQQINILQEISADLQIQLKHTNERISELLIKESDWTRKEEDFNIEINHLQAAVNDKVELHNTKDKLVQDIENNTKQQITELEKKIEEVLAENSLLHQKLNSLNESLVNIRKEKDDLKGNIISKDKKLLSVDAKLDTIYKAKEVLVAENEALVAENEAFEQNIKKLKASLKKKTKEVEEDREYWENDVKSNIETINEQCERLEQQDQEILSLQKELKDHVNCTKRIKEQAHLIEKLEKLQEESQNVFNQQQGTYEVEVNLCKKTINKLKKKVIELQAEAKIASEKREEIHPVSPVENNCNESIVPMPIQYVERCTQTLPCINSIDTNKDQVAVNSEIESKNIKMLVNLVTSMEVEIETTRAAHKKRLQRYKLLEENCNLLRRQLATYEDETVKKETKIVRASVKSLQRESSKSVWNELEYYRQQYEKFKFEKPKLNEELDELKVEQSQNGTLIDELKLEVEELRKLVYEKDMEIEKIDQFGLIEAAKVKSLQDNVKSCHQKIRNMEKDYCDLLESYNTKIENENMLNLKLSSLVSEIELLKIKPNRVMKDEVTQTDQGGNDVNKLIEEANKTSGCMLSDSCFVSAATQTVCERRKCIENGTQTIETNKSIQQSELEKIKVEGRKDKLSCKYEQLQLLKDTLLQENEKLKTKHLSLRKEVMKEMESDKAIRKYANNLENINEKLKNELLESLQTLKETTDVLEEKSKEVDVYSQELKIALSNEQKGKNIYKKKLKEIKSIEKQLEEATSKCNHLSLQVKTLTGENEMLADKQKTFQARVGRLEKDAIQKKTQHDELKLKCEELKNEANQHNGLMENLKLKLKEVAEGEKNKKVYIEELKMKIDALIKDKSTLQNSISVLTEENNNKTELLHKTQHLCHQAEMAINEVELSSVKQIEKKQKLFDDKNMKMNSCYQKCSKQLNEFKSVVTKFTEAVILNICKNHNKIIEMKKQKKRKEMEERQSSLLGNNSSNIACSILGMSTQDLVDFMNEDRVLKDDSFKYDNEMRNKLDVILKKEVNFEKVLIQFLLDLVRYNENLYQQKLTNE